MACLKPSDEGLAFIIGVFESISEILILLSEALSQ
jgi:hypothetical protein